MAAALRGSGRVEYSGRPRSGPRGERGARVEAGGAARRGSPSASRVKCLAGSPAVPATGRPMESAPADVTALPAANPLRAPRGAQSPHSRRAPPRPTPGPGQPPATASRGEVLVADPRGERHRRAAGGAGPRGEGCVRQQPSCVFPQRPRGPRWEPVPGLLGVMLGGPGEDPR